MANKEEKIKEKMLDALERAIEDPHLIDDKEWSRLFGAASLARAMSIVSKLKGRPADEQETLDENASGLTPEEEEMWAAGLLHEIVKREQIKCHGTYGQCCEHCFNEISERVHRMMPQVWAPVERRASLGELSMHTCARCWKIQMPAA